MVRGGEPTWYTAIIDCEEEYLADSIGNAIDDAGPNYCGVKAELQGKPFTPSENSLDSTPTDLITG